jgi:hypothetical protein
VEREQFFENDLDVRIFVGAIMDDQSLGVIQSVYGDTSNNAFWALGRVNTTLWLT